MEKRFTVTGMMCTACVGHVEKAVGKLPGVETVEVNLMTSSMRVVFDEKTTGEKAISAAVKKAGYNAYPVRSDDDTAGGLQNGAEMKKRLIFSIVFTALLMTVSMGHMVGIPLPDALNPHMGGSVPFILLQALLTVPVLVINRKYFAGGFRALFDRTPNMESLIAIGSGAAFVYGVYALVRAVAFTVSGQPENAVPYATNLYFESSAMILTLVLVGKTLEAFAKGKTVSALGKLIKLRPSTAMLVITGEDGTVSEKEVPVSELNVGDRLSVRSGESIPADGVVVKGSASVDESAITGESIPAEVSEGSAVTGGTIDLDGYFEMEVTKRTSESTLSEIIRLVGDAAATKAPIARLADKVSGVFVPAVMGLSVITFIIWMIAGPGFEFALNCAISVLVISCPCALGLATPVAVTVACGKSAEGGILIKNARSLENIGNAKVVFLDKTGTITTGKLRVSGVIPVSGCDETHLVRLAGAAEEMSTHPIAACVSAYAKARGAEAERAEDYRQFPGGGIGARVEGSEILIGNARLMAENGVIAGGTVGNTDTVTPPDTNPVTNPDTNPVTGATAEAALQVPAEWEIPLYVSENGKYIGAIFLSDTLKEDSREAVAELKALGIETVMLTGDRAENAAKVSEIVGTSSFRASLRPGDKEKIISGCDRRPCVMVGDGINDAPALSSADVGIALGAGTDIAIDCADIVLTGNSLRGVVYAIKTGRRAMRTIKMNLFWALFYNCMAIPVAAGALYPVLGLLLSPMLAAACMSFSSLFVVGNSILGQSRK